MAACSEVLTLNRDLLDSEFDGYKLSLDPLPIYQLSINSGIDEVKLRDDEYTFQHMQAFGLTNYLVSDLWNPSCVYYVDTEWKVLQQRVVLESQLNDSRVVFRIPDGSTKKVGSRHSISLHFPSPQLCVLSDGAGSLYILDTSDRDSAEPNPWQVVFKKEVCGGVPAILQHAVMHTQEPGTGLRIDCVLLHVEKAGAEENKADGDNKSEYSTYLEWITLKRPEGNTEFKIENTRQLSGKTAPVYCAIEDRGEGLFVASEADFKMTSDAVNPVATDLGDEKADEEKQAPPPLYTWTQTGEDLTVTFTVPETVSKPDIHLVMEADQIELKIKNGKDLLCGPLHRHIDIECSTWTLEKRKLELTLVKAEVGSMWPELVPGNTRGEYHVDPDQARIIHERLAQMTSDELDSKPTGDIGGRPGINPQDLEECDVSIENDVCLYRVDGVKHTISHKANLSSHQRLFKSPLEPQLPPCLCLRHDVDGIIWQPRRVGDDSSPWHHHATFNALGYVHASKTSCKFASCSPDVSYCVLCDCSKHAYIYRQPEEIETEVRNRHSGRVVSKVAKQQVISLDSSDDILGLQTTNERAFILTSKNLFIIRVK